VNQLPAVEPAFWRAVEALHSVVYFADGTATEYPAVGLRGFWRGYFASRAAALGTPSTELVTATFFGFAPAFVSRAIPEVWELADRDRVLDARRRVATTALTEAVGDGGVTKRVADDLLEVATGVDLAGKPLAAAHASLEAPTDAGGRLWHAATVLRELHGDCHVAVLVSEGLDGASANVLALATGLVPENQREYRGWSEDEWANAHGRLRTRGWVDADGTATPEGRAVREDIEQRTHVASNAALGAEAQRCAIALTQEVIALSRSLETSGPLVYPNPTGVPRP
jgi:hypothetical protein